MNSTALLASAYILWSSVAPAAETGTLRGRFVVDVRVPVGITLFDGDVQISRNSGLARCVLFMVREKEAPLKAIIPPASLVVNNGIFEPRLLFTKPGQSLVLFNAGQTVAVLKLGCPVTDLFATLNPGERRRIEIPPLDQEDGIFVYERLSSLHRMAMVAVQNNPYFAASDADGYFEIANVPIGNHEFTAKHVHGWDSKSLCPAWKDGIVAVNIEANKTTNLGEIHIPPALFGITDNLWRSKSAEHVDEKSDAITTRAIPLRSIDQSQSPVHMVEPR